ncbi:MAG: hypothetical protein FWF13_04680, partial [Acidobacteria bacterium]|nr:hypothetical protein [Acidobacteriota bacterium]
MSNKLLGFLKTAKKQMDGGKHAEALRVLESALGCNPAKNLEAKIYLHAAYCKCALSEYAGAVENLETALSLAEGTAYAEKKPIYDLLRIAYTHKPDYTKLAELCRMLIGIEKDKTGLMSDLLRTYTKLGKWKEMAQVLDEFPDVDLAATGILCKVRCFINVCRYKEAYQAADRYIERFGEDRLIFTNLMDLSYNVGDGEGGFNYYKKAIARCDIPDWRLSVGSILLSKDAYYGAISDGEYPDIVNDMRRSTEKLQTNTVFNNTPKPFRKIRLGYLSSDFKAHPVGFFLSPVITNTVISHCFNFCFNLAKPNEENEEDDPITTNFKSRAYRWKEVYERSDSYIERLFLTNKIDIAFDMLNHTTNNRLWLYARRLAPLQISWIGFPVTSGVAAMDYVITDKDVDPPGSEKYYTEKLLYMHGSFLCYTLESGLRIEPPAFTRNGYITFACFHNLMKITDKTLLMWRMILERCRNARLKIMGHHPLGEKNQEMLNERIREIGFPTDRLSILPTCAMKDYFAAYNDVDIMLDTYPFSGATTTFDALRMGRPIITLVGERHVSRVSYSLLKHAGLDDLAAFSEDEYVEKAVTLAGDHERLRKINIEMPRRIEDSPLINQSAFRENFEKIIRDVWVGYCLENRVNDYDYSADSPPELLEQVVNAT